MSAADKGTARAIALRSSFEPARPSTVSRPPLRLSERLRRSAPPSFMMTVAGPARRILLRPRVASNFVISMRIGSAGTTLARASRLRPRAVAVSVMSLASTPPFALSLTRETVSPPMRASSTASSRQSRGGDRRRSRRGQRRAYRGCTKASIRCRGLDGGVLPASACVRVRSASMPPESFCSARGERSSRSRVVRTGRLQIGGVERSPLAPKPGRCSRPHRGTRRRPPAARYGGSLAPACGRFRRRD